MKKETKTYSIATTTEIKVNNLEEIRKETIEFIKKHKKAFEDLKNK